MLEQIKNRIKRLLAAVNLQHPSLGVKISQDEKASIILGHTIQGFGTFVETGTKEGWMIEMVANRFEKIYSIELDESLYQRAREHFKNEKHIKLLHGDSAIEIRKILSEINEPTLFWLDAHNSGMITAGNSPIIRELEAIFTHPIKNHTVLIDDARHFDLKTISEMRKMSKMNNYTFAIENGIFRLHGR